MAVRHSSGTAIRTIALRELVGLDRNARYMSGAQWSRLVENLRRDGRLTSVPLVARAADAPLTEAGGEDREALEVLSGNHRVSAAIEAGIERGEIMEIHDPLTREQKIALQLSHNQVEGQDDPNVLRALYEELSFDWKEYSGLDDDAFKVEDLELQSIAATSPDYQELTFFFLPEEAEVFTKAVEAIEKRSRAKMAFVAPVRDFDAVFNAVVSTKERCGIHNSAIALRRMGELALERLDEIEGFDAEE